MEPTTIANNMRRLRLSRGQTQEEVASAASVSIAAYRNYEAGRAVPRVNTLLALAEQLGTNLSELVTEPRTLSAVRFRAHKKLNTRHQILVDVANWLDDFTELEELTGQTRRWMLSGLKAASTPEKTAAKARRDLRLSEDEPIRDICGLLEFSGIKVLSRSVSSEYFFGLSVGPEDGGPAIVVNTWDRIPVERWIFSAAHELGHILLHRNSFKAEEEAEIKEQEDEANRFASHLLMPRELFDKEWAEAFGLPFLDRVFKIKRMLRVSYATVLYRLQEKGYENVWQQFYFQYSRRYGRSLSRKDEPSPLAADAFKVVEDKASQEPKRLDDVDFVEDRLSCLVRTALEKELITRDRAAEILHLAPDAMVERIEEWVA